MTHPTKICKTCGAPFETSATGYTVRCPGCRKGGTPRKAAACVVCLDARVITTRHADGRMVTTPCFRCAA